MGNGAALCASARAHPRLYPLVTLIAFSTTINSGNGRERDLTPSIHETVATVTSGRRCSWSDALRQASSPQRSRPSHSGTRFAGEGRYRLRNLLRRSVATATSAVLSSSTPEGSGTVVCACTDI